MAANRERVRESQRRNAEKYGDQYRAAQRQRYAEDAADPEKAAAKREASRQYYQANREQILQQVKTRRAERVDAARRSTHGTDDWDALFSSLWDAQQGMCYLCGDPLQRDVPRAIHLDHDHACCPLAKSCERCRRGLACKDCNRMIGIAKDDPDRLRRMADGLERAKADVALRMQQPRQIRKPRTYEVQCKECGETFTARRSDDLFCSSACYGRLRYRERRAPGGTVSLTCESCGIAFMARGKAKYCSKQCSNRAYQIRKGLRVPPLPAPDGDLEGVAAGPHQ